MSRRRKTNMQSLWDVLGGPELHQRRHELLERMGSSAVVRERFWSKVKKGHPDDCWNWTGQFFKRGGYGRFSITENGRNVRLRANRVAYYFSTGNYSEDLYVCHSCDNPKCCNPKHFFLGTHPQNQQDKVEKGRTPKGTGHFYHILTEKQVEEARHRCLVLGETRASVAKLFNVKYYTVVCAVLGRNWKHVPMPTIP